MRALIALALLTLSLGCGASELRTFELRHRPAAELIPILQPMLDEDAALSGTGFTLIVRASEQNLARVASLLERLDRAPEPLLILVEQGATGQAQRSGVGLSGNSEAPRFQAHLYHDRRDGTEHIGQRLRVMEGQWATIRAGQSVPQVVQYSDRNGHTTQHIEYHNVESGFEVRPRLNGERVILDIRPFRASLADGTLITQQRITTSVSGRVGAWIELGATVQDARQQGRGILYSTTESQHSRNSVRIKVERIDD